MTYAAD